MRGVRGREFGEGEQAEYRCSNHQCPTEGPFGGLAYLENEGGHECHTSAGCQGTGDHVIDKCWALPEVSRLCLTEEECRVPGRGRA